ncbi:MAG TPA: hypothetical protein VJX47_12525 [Candidatus Sulfotelmatobacter sp.]|nr:hypothetical protein [Candidatus Sulfotelmatobacter sp.]
MKLTLGMLVLLITAVVTSPVAASGQQENSTSSAQQIQEASSADSSAQSILYKNTRYGFSFSLPETWKGYTILTDKWESGDPEKGSVEHGAVISIRHPDWTKEKPRQDIPIMIFTVAQWDSIEHGNLSVSVASVGPAELGRNRKYVFALAPRVRNSDLTGGAEVNEILKHDPLRPFWTK